MNPFGKHGCNYISLILFLMLMIFPKAATAAQPNVIIIIADDLGWNDVGYHGSEIKTPTMDKLATEGVELNRFYAHPSCSPTRSALMTGQSPIRLGISGPLSKNNPKGLPLSATIMPQYFKKAGYQTALVGKWHLGRYKKEYWPQNRGFDHFYGYLTGGIGYWDHVHGGALDWQRNGKTIREEGYSTHLLTAESVKLIKNRDPDKPFFMVTSYPAPHMPNEAPEETISRYRNIESEFRRVHCAMVTELDSGIHKIIKALEDEKMMDSTIVWFMSDNGGLNFEAASEQLQNLVVSLSKIFDAPLPVRFLEFARTNIMESAADNTPLKRGKKSVMEGGIRVPSFIYAPKILSPHKSDSLISVDDVLPTLASAAGLNIEPEGSIDGIDTWKTLTKESAPKPGKFITRGWEGNAILKGDWKLILPASGEPELYNLLEDPLEDQNVAKKNEEIVNELRKEHDALPRGEIVNLPVWKIFFDMDFFGGKEDRRPMAGFEGHNAGPTHPSIYIALMALLLACLIFWRRS